jgi:prevent-host-death family protein
MKTTTNRVLHTTGMLSVTESLADSILASQIAKVHCPLHSLQLIFIRLFRGVEARDDVIGSGPDRQCPLQKDQIKTIFRLNRFGSRVMRYSLRVKPISYLKANAAELLTQLREEREPLVITQNGEAKAVLQDVASYEETQETLALLKVLSLGNAEVQAGKTSQVSEVVARLRAKSPAR